MLWTHSPKKLKLFHEGTRLVLSILLKSLLCKMIQAFLDWKINQRHVYFIIEIVWFFLFFLYI
jgi:hypothetical protein